MSDLDALLGVQTHDTAIDQLVHRRAGLPEREELAKKKAERSKMHVEINEVEAARHEVEREQKRFEDDVAAVEAKVASANNKLYNVSMTSPKEAQTIQTEIASHQARLSELEGSVLECMVRIEPHNEQLGSLHEVVGAIDDQIRMLSHRIEDHEVDIDAKLAAERQARDAAASPLPDALLEQYERLRSQMGGVAVAKLAGDRCMGCNLGLPAAEYDRIKRLPADEIVHCFECGRLLVR